MTALEDKQIQRWIDQVAEENPEALTMDGHDNAIIGIARSPGEPSLLAYSRSRILLNLFTRDKMPMEEAVEFFEFNIVGAYMGVGTPVIIDD